MAGDGEHALIARHFRPLAAKQGTYSLLDDAASLTPPAGCDLVLTKDGIAAGIHFPDDETAANVARRALRVNLSDLAAKGAAPLGYLLLLGLTDAQDEAWLEEFAAALGEDQAKYGIALYGGDTIRAAGLTVSVTAFGTVPQRGMVRRDGARRGDRLYVTGTIGDAALGLRVVGGGLSELSAAHRGELEERYRVPLPRCAMAATLRAHAAAALDVSDGLAGDLDKLCLASGVGAEVDVGAVPLSGAARAAVAADTSLLELCLSGGDDYEILCAVREDRAEEFESAARRDGVPVTAIGRVGGKGGTAEFFRDGRPVALGVRAYSHRG